MANGQSKLFFRKRCEIIAKSRGLTRWFAYGELVCFPISVGVVGAVAVHSLLVLLTPALAKIGVSMPILVALPSWFTAIFVSAAIGYLTNYIAIQMLYYPVDGADLGIAPCDGVEARRPASPQERDALFKSSIISFVTFGFWKKARHPRFARECK